MDSMTNNAISGGGSDNMPGMMNANNESGVSGAVQQVTGGHVERMSDRVSSFFNLNCTKIVISVVAAILAVIVFSPWMFSLVNRLLSKVSDSVRVLADGRPTTTGMAIHGLVYFLVVLGFMYLPPSMQPATWFCGPSVFSR